MAELFILKYFELKKKILFLSIFLTLRVALNIKKCASIVVLALFFFLPSMVLASKNIEVTILGIDGRLYDNVVSRLRIYKNREATGVTDRDVKKMHNEAEEEIKDALQPFGYYSPVILSNLEKEEDGWRASYSVNKGEPVRVTKILISIETTVDLPEEIAAIAPSFLLKEGDILDHVLYDKGKKLILGQLFALGFLQAEFERKEILLNRTTRSAEIILDLQSGARFLFGRTTFHQDLVDPELLQRYVHFQEGEPYSPKKLIELQRFLYKTNYFGQVVIKGETGKAKDFHVPISINLSEPTYYNRYTLGLGYATDDGLRGKVGWDNRLLNTSGHTVTSEIKIAERESSLKFVYGVPVFDPRFDKILSGITYDDEQWDDTDTRLFKGGVAYDHAARRYKYGGGLELRDEKYEVGATTGESFLLVPAFNWSITLSDDLTKARNGLLVSAEVMGAAEDVFADTTFLQGRLSGKVIVTPLESFRLIGRMSLGATSVDSIDDLPPSLRFYAGGDQSVRGYGYKTLGPEDSSGTVIGGKYLIYGSIEAEKVVSGNWSMAAFFDSGNAVEKLTDDLKEGVGIGVRYRLPFGQLRVDVASAISEDGNPLRLHITVGGDL